MSGDASVDEDVVRAARDLMDRRYRPGQHCVGAALRTAEGELFTGVHVEASCGRVTVCAEAIAIGAAATAQDVTIEQIVAVTESGDIIPPCGMCRELISDYAPEARVILERDGVVVLVAVRELLPDKYDSSRYPNRREAP